MALIVLPFALLCRRRRRRGPSLAVAAVGALVLVAVSDAVGARGSLGGLSVILPAVARMSKDREAKLDLQVRNERQQPLRLRVGLALAARNQIRARGNGSPAAGRGGDWSHLAWPCRPRQRGNYQLDAVYLEASSPLGLWSVRQVAPARAEIRVYPNLLEERSSMAALFLNRGAFGAHAQRQVGKGREFEKLREYVPGDGYEDIHWKATARRGQAHHQGFSNRKDAGGLCRARCLAPFRAAGRARAGRRARARPRTFT